MSVWQNLPEEVGWYLPPSACLLYLQYLSSPVWSNACRQPCASFDFPFFFFFLTLSLFFLMTGMDGLCLFLLFHHFVHPWFFFVCAPFLHYHHHHLHLSFSLWVNFTILDSPRPSESQIDELGKWNFVRCTFLVKSDYDQTQPWFRVFAVGQLFFFLVRTFALATGSWGSMLS